MPASSISRCPLDETSTGSTTSRGRAPDAASAATALTMPSLASIPVFTARTSKSASTV